jgi:hypothetical protein
MPCTTVPVLRIRDILVWIRMWILIRMAQNKTDPDPDAESLKYLRESLKNSNDKS